MPPERGVDPLTESPRLFTVIPQLSSDDYYTPPWVFDRMGITFDLDVAAPPGGVEWVPARHYYDSNTDGLAQPWTGRVWMNPPYSQCAPWVRRFIAHRHGIALLPHSCTGWYVDLWDTADALVSVGKFTFVSPIRRGRCFLPVFFAAFGDDCTEAIGRLGTVRRA